MLEKGLWRDILDARYGSWRSLDVALFKGINLRGGRICVRYVVGDGRSVKIWEDRWVEGQVLKETFPRLFLISQCKDSLVGDLADLGHVRSGRCYNWNLDWRRERCEWEKRLEVQLLDMVSRVHWSIEGQDGLLWEGNNQKAYTVKFGYSVLNREDLMYTLEVF